MTAIVLNYKRPHNIQPLVRSLLRCAFITKIVVCNNNPDGPIERWVRIRDRRLILTNRPENGGTLARFEIARDDDARYFVAIDDDILLTPAQIADLVAKLLDEPSRVHGVYGQLANPDGSFVDAIHGVECDIDIINRAYAFTSDHVLEFFRLAGELGLPHRLLTVGDDMVLSFSGTQCPRCHDVGYILDCPTEGIPGIASWREPHFHDHRSAIFRLLVSIKGRTEPYRPSGSQQATTKARPERR